MPAEINITGKGERASGGNQPPHGAYGRSIADHAVQGVAAEGKREEIRRAVRRSYLVDYAERSGVYGPFGFRIFKVQSEVWWL